MYLDFNKQEVVAGLWIKDTIRAYGEEQKDWSIFYNSSFRWIYLIISDIASTRTKMFAISAKKRYEKRLHCSENAMRSHVIFNKDGVNLDDQSVY